MNQVDPALFQENERTAPMQESRRYIETGPFRCEAGGELPSVTIAYETWGKLNEAASNAVLICHALSGDSHAIGWWDRLVGPGRAIDTDRYFVIGTNALGGCQGTTGPSSIAPDGRPFGSRFPQVTVGDLVEAMARVVDHLGVDRLHAIAGGSMGGMLALEWAVRFPARVQNVIASASAAAHTALQIAYNEIARQAIRRDPRWRGGDYDPCDPPADGLSVARMVGHLSYLSQASFEAKFARRLQEDGTGRFQVESYLSYQGDKFVKRFDPNSLIVLSSAIDRYELSTLAGAQARFLFVSYTSDTLYPSWQSAKLHEMALAASCKSRWEDIDLPYGHDAFLLDGVDQGALIRGFLADDCP